MKKLLIGLCLIFSLNCFGADTAQVYPPNAVLKFKGLDDTSSLLTVQDERAQNLQNVNISISNSVSKRKGYGIIGDRFKRSDTTDFPAITGLYYTKLSTGTEFILATSGKNFYSLLSNEWVSKTGVVLTYSQDNQFVWTTALDTIVFTNDVDVPLKYIGSGNSAVLDVSDLSDTLTKTKAIAWFKNYFIHANTVENSTERPTRFRWSDVGTVETYDDDNFIDIAALGGQEINALIELYDNLYILMTDSIWKATLVGGDDIFIITKVVDNIGCIAKNSVQSVNILNQRKGIIFLSKNKKIHFFDGTNITEISHLITDEMGDLNESRLQYAVSDHTGNNYRICVTTSDSSTTNNLLLDFQTEIGEWSKHIQIDANAMARVVASNINKTYFGNYNAFTYELDTTANNDVTGQNDSVTSVGTINLVDGTATGLTIIIPESGVTYNATGATITITVGSGVGEEKVIVDGTGTGLIVDSAFTATPDDNSQFSIGTIEAFYETKWYDMGQPSRRKNMGKGYLWVEASSGSNISIEETLDFSAVLKTTSLALAGSGALWGVGVWGTDVWGGEEAIFLPFNLEGTGRFAKLKFTNNEIDETFNLLGLTWVYWLQDVQ